jgi:hypothetical protein
MALLVLQVITNRYSLREINIGINTVPVVLTKNSNGDFGNVINTVTVRIDGDIVKRGLAGFWNCFDVAVNVKWICSRINRPHGH